MDSINRFEVEILPQPIALVERYVQTEESGASKEHYEPKTPGKFKPVRKAMEKTRQNKIIQRNRRPTREARKNQVCTVYE